MADLSRFLTAQNEGTPSTFDRALNELKNGRKRSHWIWFVLPQLRCLGRSATAIHFGIKDLEEARAYLADPVLRERLEQVIAVLAEQLERPDQSLRKLMGKPIDATKTISSLTLFEAVWAMCSSTAWQSTRRCWPQRATTTGPGNGSSGS